MTTALTWLMLANVAIWLGFGMYLAFIGYQQKKLAQRLSNISYE